MNTELLKKVLISMMMLLVGIIGFIAFLPGGQAAASINYWSQFDLFTDHHHDPPQPTLSINHRVGQKGSYFLFTMQNYPILNNTLVKVNDTLVGTVQLDDQGAAQFELNTTDANNGVYFVTVTAAVDGPSQYDLQAVAEPTAMTTFTIAPDAPLHESMGTVDILPVPAGIATFYYDYLPILTKE